MSILRRKGKIRHRVSTIDGSRMMLVVSGMTIIKFFPENSLLLVTRYVFLHLGVAVLLFGLYRFNAIRRELQSLYEKPNRYTEVGADV